MSTLPKHVQALNSSTVDDSTTSSQSRAQNYKDFIERYKTLPDDFLRIPQSNVPAHQDQNTSIVPQQTRAHITRDAPLVDMIDISVVEAQLNKNYGLLRMDLYCKIRVGHMVCETQTCLNGAKNPKWDGVYQFSLKPGIDTFHLEIYDEKQFSLDEKIAWLYETIPPEIFQGITVERWFPLSGRLGPNKEGSVLLVLSHKRVPMRGSNFARAANLTANAAPMVFVPSVNQGPIITGPPMISQVVDPNIGPAYVQPTPTGTETTTNEHMPASEEDVNQLSEMFPSIDKAVIKAILENHQNDKEATISALLALG